MILSSSLKIDLRNSLTGELPGYEAHRLMDPLRPNQRLEADDRHARESAVLILLTPRADRVYFPLIQRPQYNGHHSGQVALPGGKLEEEDDSLQTTALRETHEEIGIAPEGVEVLGALSKIFVPPSNFNITPYIGWLEHEPTYIPDTKEVERVFESSVQEVIDSSTRKTESIKLKNNMTIQAPAFHLEGGMVWGATAMILSEFAMLIERMKYE